MERTYKVFITWIDGPEMRIDHVVKTSYDGTMFQFTTTDQEEYIINVNQTKYMKAVIEQ